MSGTPYNGNPGNVLPPGSVGITSSTNATPIVIQTSSAHGMKTNDVVHIQGHTLNTNANGKWPVVVSDTTHFSLTGSTTTGFGGGSTGAAQPLTFTGNVGLNPANGDPFDASTFIPGMSALGDRTAWQASVTGIMIPVRNFSFGSTVSGETAAYGINPTVGTSTWGDFTSTIAGLMPFVNADIGSPLHVIVGDVVRITFNSTTILNTTFATVNAKNAIGLWSANWVPGGTQSYTEVNTGVCTLNALNNASTPGQVTQSVSLVAQVICGTSGFFDYKIRFFGGDGCTAGFAILLGGFFTEAIVYRGTGWPQ